MLNLLLRILLAVSAIVLLVAIIGSLLPRDFATSARIEIQATPEQVFPFLVDLKRWQTWSPWNAHESPNLQVNYGEQTSGVGATQTWSEPRGEGKLWITAVTPPRSIEFASRFANFPQMHSTIGLTARETATEVVWTSEGSLPGGPFYGWFGMLFPSAIGNEYNKSLQQLKAAVERSLISD